VIITASLLTVLKSQNKVRLAQLKKDA